MARDGKRAAEQEAFEALYQRLEASVAKLEQGGLSLEEAIAVYEEGITLARACQERLDAAELRIARLKESFAALPPTAGPAAVSAEIENAGDDESPEDGDRP